VDYPAHTAEQLGAILRGFRKQRGLTQQELAARVGLAQKAVSAAETHPGRVGLERLLELLGALEVELVLRDKPARPRSRREW
jgi:HTH-type transcriptional regulator / antitoxin HipB